MARKDRTGNRKFRDQRRPLKIPALGCYLIVTDTEATERCYFQEWDTDSDGMWKGNYKGIDDWLTKDQRSRLRAA